MSSKKTVIQVAEYSSRRREIIGTVLQCSVELKRSMNLEAAWTVTVIIIKSRMSYFYTYPHSCKYKIAGKAKNRAFKCTEAAKLCTTGRMVIFLCIRYFKYRRNVKDILNYKYKTLFLKE